MFAIIYLLILGVYLEGIKGTYFSIMFNNRASAFLSKISLPLFLNQGWLRHVIKSWNFEWSYEKSLIVYAAIAFLIATVIVYLVKFSGHVFKKKGVTNER